MIHPAPLFALLLAAADTSELTGLTGWIADVMEALGAIGVGALILLETVFPPIPSEVVLLLAGFLAGQGSMNVVAVIVSATIGSIAGSLILYWGGAALGRRRFFHIVKVMPMVDVADIEKAEEWFNRHGSKAVFFGRMVPLVRSGISVPAGITRMPLTPYIIYSAAGSAIWNSIFIGLGYALGDQWEDVGSYSDWINRAVYAAVVLFVAWYIIRHFRKNSDARRRDIKNL